MIGELEIIFGVDAIARALRVGGHVLVFLEQLAGIAARAIIDAAAVTLLAALALAAATAAAIAVAATTATAPAAALTIVDQRCRSLFSNNPVSLPDGAPRRRSCTRIAGGCVMAARTGARLKDEIGTAPWRNVTLAVFRPVS